MSIRRTSGTSAVFDAWEALYNRIASAPLPSSDDGQPPPVVLLSDSQADYPHEYVAIVTRIDDNDAEWVTLGNAQREERIVFWIRFECDLPGRDQAAVLRRLRGVSDAIQQALRDPDGQPAWLGFEGEVKTMQVTRVVPLITGSSDGAQGRVDHFVAVTARI